MMHRQVMHEKNFEGPETNIKQTNREDPTNTALSDKVGSDNFIPYIFLLIQNGKYRLYYYRANIWHGM